MAEWDGIELIGERTVHRRATLLVGAEQDSPKVYVRQRYYVEGLRALDGLDFTISPFWSNVLARLYDVGLKGSAKLWSTLAAIGRYPRSPGFPHVARYLLSDWGEPIRFAIDTEDNSHVADASAYEWAHYYFKANWWPTIDYPTKVRPIINGNGYLNSRRLRFLKTLRVRPKTTDLIFRTVLWPSPQGPNYLNNIEHHVRLFESLAQIPCNKQLQAVVPANVEKAIPREYLARLHAAGVPWTRGWQTTDFYGLASSLAQASVVFLRPGKRLCISWRMIDLLCMGACVVYDRDPYPQWPVPLQPGKNYVSCDCGLDRDDSLPPPQHYARVRDRIERLLADENTMRRIREQNVRYFEHHACPRAVAEYILTQARAPVGSAIDVAMQRVPNDR